VQGDPAVLELLNDVLTSELTSVNQYFVHAKLCEHWGYDRLAEKIRAESIEEMKHVEELADRILYLEGMPNFQRLFSVRVGETVPEQFQLDLETERESITQLNDGIATCVRLGDNGSRELLAGMLVDEEEHADWLETQLEAIRQVGVENYLTEQLH
jgi:bacterioferritin